MKAATNQNDQSERFTRRYRSQLRRHLNGTSRVRPTAAGKLGNEAVTLEMEVLDVAAIHDQSLVDLVSPAEPLETQQRVLRKAASFFAEVIVPIEATHRTAIENNATLLRLNTELKQRAKDVSSAQRRLDNEIAKRRRAEQKSSKSESESKRLLRQSRDLEKDMRLLSCRILTNQEEERKRISRELHDLVAQTLTAINVHLANLKKETTQNARGLKKNITRTQKLVERSVDKVHRFARELRPAVLDDLGLIPALRSFLESLAQESGIRVKFTASAEIEDLDNDRLTVLYRIAQEALTNVTRHARATCVSVQLKASANAVCLRITDDGQSFDVEKALRGGKRKCMGLLGMRERAEMVGGTLTIESSPDQGTTITTRVPFQNSYRKTGNS